MIPFAVVAAAVVALPALIHVMIFVFESVRWTQPAVWRRFGVPDQQQAEQTKGMAFNQGFYNLFLAIGAVLGVVLIGIGMPEAGLAITLFALGSMLLASLVLVISSPKLIRAAATQGAPALLAIAGLLALMPAFAS